MANPTEATSLLHGAVNPRMRLSVLSRTTGLSRQRLRTLVSGGEPTASEMAKLQKALGIPLEAWTRPADDLMPTPDGGDHDAVASDPPDSNA